MIKIDDHTKVNLKKLALVHYQSLIGEPLVDGISYHSVNSLIGRIVAQREKDKNDVLKTQFWDYFLVNSYVNLKRVIVSRPIGLKKIINEVTSVVGHNALTNAIDYHNAQLTPFGQVVQKVFNYALYRGKETCANNVEKLNIQYCPYCNENKVQIITRINSLTLAQKKMALLQLDHFYPQSRYPFLAVSFFNLIPGCSPCNAQLKLETDFDIDTHFNPFHRRLDDYFRFNLRTLLISGERDVSINYTNIAPSVDNQLKDFEILNRYDDQSTKRLIFRLVIGFKNRSPKIVNSISQQLPGLFAGIVNEKDKLHLLNVPVSRKEINSVHLGKLKRDICIQLGLLKR